MVHTRRAASAAASRIRLGSERTDQGTEPRPEQADFGQRPEQSASASEQRAEQSAQNSGGAGGRDVSARQEVSGGGQGAEPLVQVLGALAQLLERLPGVAQGPAVGHAPPPVGHAAVGEVEERVPHYLAMLEMMGKLGTRRFGGESDPVKADEWRSRIERNFASIRCPDQYKTDIAVHFLGEAANDWWLGVSGSMRVAECSWAMFLAAFKAKFFPPEAADRLEGEFLSLKQGDRTVRELEAEFNRLKKYSGRELSEEAEIRAFMRCLRIELRNRVLARKVETLTELVETAASLEAGLEEESRQLRGSKPPMVQHQAVRSGGQQGIKRKLDSDRGGSKSGAFRAPCTRCGKWHSGRCKAAAAVGGCFRCGGRDHRIGNCPQEPSPQEASLRKARACYNCGEPGHFSASCPKRAQGSQQPPAKRQSTPVPVAPRVFTIEDGNIGASTSRQISG